MKYRLAKFCDSKSLANLHIECSKYQQGGFMHTLGIHFLSKYYEITIKNKYSVIIVVEDEKGVIVGFHSGTLDAEEHYNSLKENKFKFILPVFLTIIRNPNLFFEIYTRYKSISVDKNLNFGVKSGIRGEYWGWLPSMPNSVESVNLHRVWHLTLKQLGATYVRSEVDIVNERIYRSIKVMGGFILQEITLHDGRKRAIVEYDLSKY